MFSPNPAIFLRGLAAHLRRNGIIVFHEADVAGVRSDPPSPTYDACFRWVVQTFRQVGTNPHMGLNLYSAFLAAGLPAPEMKLNALVGGGDSDLSGLDLLADLATTLAPVMEQTGVVTTEKLAPATLYERMRAEALANGSVVTGFFEVGGWARMP
jgi:hypothetical protein